MQRPKQPVLPRIEAVLLPLVLWSFLSGPDAWSQMSPGSGGRGRYVQLEVTIHDSSGEILSVPADVRLSLNGTPCGEASTTNGRASFTLSDIGNFTVVVLAAGYKAGQNEVYIAEPVTAQLEITLRRESSSILTPQPGGGPILAPKAKKALDSGMQALRENKLVDAEKALGQATKLAPNNPQVLFAQGLLDLRKHEWTTAQSVLEKVTQMEPNSARPFAALGMALCNQKKYTEAISPLEKSLSLDPSVGWETHWSLGESYYHNERYEEALKASQQAEAESNGQEPQVELLVARALTAVGRYEDSAKVLRELLKNHSDGPEAATARRFLDRLTSDGKIQQR